MLQRQGLEMSRKHLHEAHNATLVDIVARGDVSDAEYDLELPTVLLSHVPLFREPGTPCGPLREKHPPTAPRLEVDEPNAIRLGGGFQYQNVLTKALTKTIAEKVGNVSYAFSGDDHDYCEVTHRAYPSAGGGIKEITVKSMSWAMGVRKPGFLLASLWNPIDQAEASLHSLNQAPDSGTIQTHLCLLPNQLAIFIRYALLLIFTLLAVIVHSVVMAQREMDGPASGPSNPVLPLREPSKTFASKVSQRSRASSGSAYAGGTGMLAPRSETSRARSVSPAPFGGYGLPQINTQPSAPLISQAGYYPKSESPEWDDLEDERPPSRSRRRQGFVARLGEQFGRTMLIVAGPTLVWYWYLMTSG